MQISRLVIPKVEKFGIERVYMLHFYGLKNLFHNDFELDICGDLGFPGVKLLSPLGFKSRAFSREIASTFLGALARHEFYSILICSAALRYSV